METTEYLLQDWILKAERYAAAGEHCSNDVRHKMQQWQAPDEYVEPVLSHLVLHRFIDESRYAAAFVRDKVLFQGWGRYKILAGLKAKRIPDAVIRDALLTIDSEAYRSALRKAAATKKNAAREQQMRFLLQRGFSYSDIEDAELF